MGPVRVLFLAIVSLATWAGLFSSLRRVAGNPPAQSMTRDLIISLLSVVVLLLYLRTVGLVH